MDNVNVVLFLTPPVVDSIVTIKTHDLNTAAVTKQNFKIVHCYPDSEIVLLENLSTGEHIRRLALQTGGG